jgi:hypothetical protein
MQVRAVAGFDHVGFYALRNSVHSEEAEGLRRISTPFDQAKSSQKVRMVEKTFEQRPKGEETPLYVDTMSHADA